MNNTDIKTVELVINSERANKKLETARRKKTEAFEQGNAIELEAPPKKECRNLERQKTSPDHAIYLKEPR